jgi:hypothetical protein
MTSPAEFRTDLLLAEYVACFEKYDELSHNPTLYPITASLSVGEPNEYGRVHWRPRRTDPDPSLLNSLYARLPARFPPLFERLLLTFRWANVSLDVL